MTEFDTTGFRAWLEATREDEVVGVAFDPGDCPLARFGAAIGQAGPVYLTHRLVRCGNDRWKRLKNPRWARRYALLVDLCGQPMICAAKGAALLKLTEWSLLAANQAMDAWQLASMAMQV